MRNRETKIERERVIDGEPDREADKETDRENDRDTVIQRQTERQRDRQFDCKKKEMKEKGNYTKKSNV